MKKLKLKMEHLHNSEMLTRDQMKNVMRSSFGGTAPSDGGGGDDCCTVHCYNGNIYLGAVSIGYECPDGNGQTVALCMPFYSQTNATGCDC